MLDFFSIADLCVDVLLTGNTRPQFSQVEQLIDDYAFELGGSATICAAQFANLGGTAGILGRVGDDFLGRFILERLATLQLDLRHVHQMPTLKTGVGFALIECDDRAILTYLGSIDAVMPDMLTDNLLGIAKHWHIASYFLLQKLQPAWPGWLQKLRSHHVTVSLDTNWSPTGNWHDIIELLPLVDWFLPNAAEALAITGLHDLTQAGKSLASHGCGVVIKCGKDGAIAFKNSQTIHAPATPVPTVVDTIGAGDCFDAGFFRAWQLGYPLDRCLQTAIACGSAVVQAPGGFSGQIRTHLAK